MVVCLEHVCNFKGHLLTVCKVHKSHVDHVPQMLSTCKAAGVPQAAWAAKHSMHYIPSDLVQLQPLHRSKNWHLLVPTPLLHSMFHTTNLSNV